MQKKTKTKAFFSMGNEDKFLVADVGGTKTQLLLGSGNAKDLRLEASDKFLNKDFSCLEDILKTFIAKHNASDARDLVIGAAGEVKKGICLPTNLDWTINVESVKKRCNIENILLLNDIELLGAGVESLEKEDLFVLQAGEQKESDVRAVLSVGTGLGECVIAGDRVMATEGGHGDFAASTRCEIDFLRWMQKLLGHVSYERVLSGDGIKNAYEFYSKKRNLHPREILAGENKEAVQASVFFLNVLGKEAGNLALRSLCCGGLYLYGGVLQKNMLLLQEEGFLKSFTDKGRFSKLLKTIPIYLIKGNRVLLLGGINWLNKAKIS